MRIVTLDHDVLSRVYATWELYTQACQGDIPHEPDSVLRFAAQRLQAWYASLRGEKTADQVHEPLMAEETVADTPQGDAAPIAAVAVAAAAPAIPAPVAPVAVVSPSVAAVTPTALPKPPKLISAPAQPSSPAPVSPPVVEKAETAPKVEAVASAAGDKVETSPKADAPTTVESANGSSAPATLGDVLRHLIRIRRFVSFAEISDELRTKMSREITLEEATAAAESTGDIRVYAQGGNAGFLWQGW